MVIARQSFYVGLTVGCIYLDCRNDPKLKKILLTNNFGLINK